MFITINSIAVFPEGKHSIMIKVTVRNIHSTPKFHLPLSVPGISNTPVYPERYLSLTCFGALPLAIPVFQSGYLIDLT
jgi:hypothetical protein